MQPTILVLDDDEDLLAEICETLEMEGFATLRAGSVGEFWPLAEGCRIDLYLLDVVLPDGSGLSVAKEVRRKSSAGIIMLTRRASEMDRVVGLEIGADDYVSKPFSPRELVARVRSVLRRASGDARTGASGERADGREVVEFSGWTLDLGARELFAPDGAEVVLTTKEFELLRALVESPGRAHSRDFLLDRMHGQEWAGYDRGIDGLVSRLRKKLKAKDSAADFIKTVRGAGYMFTPTARRH